jgi:uncharacterized protein YecE (DUF72 family)
MAVLFGTCGWSYQEWVGAFYPNNRVAKLPFYARTFDSVEVDSSFYRPPSKSMTAGWVRATGPAFKFSLKVPKTITHDKQLLHSEKDTSEFLERIEPITRAGKLGCLLIQLPASFTFRERDNLQTYFGLLPEGIHFAVEFRHESWDRQDTWDLLKKYNIANTITDSPLRFLSKPVITSTTHAYIRWHGRGKSVWYDYRYSESELAEWRKKLADIEGRVPLLYGYFNNHYGANAPSNLLALLEMRGELTEVQEKAMRRADRFQKKIDLPAAKLTDYL